LNTASPLISLQPSHENRRMMNPMRQNPHEFRLVVLCVLTLLLRLQP